MTADSRPKGPSWDGDRVAEFYSGESAGWREVLGPGMHYHFGTIDPARPIDDAAAHFSFGVRQLYPWIPTGSRVIDVGCGWGGPARMLIDERHCDIRGVTISEVQAAECARVVPEARVSVADAQKLELDGDGERFDLAIMLESLTHMSRPDLVLRNLRPAVGRVLIRDHVAAGESGFLNDDWNMRFPLRAEMRGQLEDAGFQIIHEEAIEVPWCTSAQYWLDNIRRAFPLYTPEGQFRTLQRLCESIVLHSGLSGVEIVLFVAE
ncbi:MAG: methyltransferase domain-containing protein [Planctomycetota bacterium]|nr:methyltransferase domain-containing protein [Planctomycetota bacterium]